MGQTFQTSFTTSLWKFQRWNRWLLWCWWHMPAVSWFRQLSALVALSILLTLCEEKGGNKQWCTTSQVHRYKPNSCMCFWINNVSKQCEANVDFRMIDSIRQRHNMHVDFVFIKCNNACEAPDLFQEIYRNQHRRCYPGSRIEGHLMRWR